MDFRKYFESIPDAGSVTKETSQKVLKIVNEVKESFIRSFEDIDHVCQVSFQGYVLNLFDETRDRLMDIGFKCEEIGPKDYKTLLVSIPDDCKDCNNIVFPSFSTEEEVLDYLHDNYNIPNLVCTMNCLNELAINYARGLQYSFAQKIEALRESKANFFTIDLPKTVTKVDKIFIHSIEDKKYFTFRDDNVLYVSNEKDVILELERKLGKSV